MSPITEPNPLDFQSAQPLSEGAQLAISEVFGRTWPEPQKLHHQSAKVRQLLEESRESIAANLGVSKASLEFVGELGFGYWSVLAGSLTDFRGRFIHGATDRQIVHSFARMHQGAGAESITAPCDNRGGIDYQDIIDAAISISGAQPTVLFWQSTNRETGARQSRSSLNNISEDLTLIADMTAAFSPNELPQVWDIALWDPRNFAGPEGLSIISIKSERKWRSPIPAIDNRRLFNSYSKPLLVLTALALDEWRREHEKHLAHIRRMNSILRQSLIAQVPDLEIASPSDDADPRFLALVIKDVIAEELLRELQNSGALVDAGSACGSGALSPSHVLQAMGYGTDGHIRLTLKRHQGEAEIQTLVRELANAVLKCRTS